MRDAGSGSMVVTSEANVLSDEARAVLAIGSVPHILDIVCRSTGMGFAAVARVTGDRWIACASRDRLHFGLGPGDELDVQTTLCKETRAGRQAIVIDDVQADERWREHPTPRQYGFRSYASVPIIRRDGTFFGTLCAIDPSPRRVSEPGALAMFRGFAELIGRQLDDQDALTSSRTQLRAERASSRLREEFVAVLGHDLRSPLASISSGLRVLEREGLPERSARTVALMQATAGRMNALIENLLDLARGRLGRGIAFEIAPCADLRTEIEQVIGEIRAATGREIAFDWQVEGAVSCDRRRMGQLSSNLVTNAVKHGDAASPVRVECRLDGGQFRLAVENRGDPIPPAITGSLFRPFFRGGGEEGRQGLGLGLYIAREIARAHEGTLTVDSTEE
ncbi:MAG TPA: GAF domain-containing sensor histidine kinase, partial [Paracoccaceae bacterium]|nr:GAF domain-containing sensor histidine kinase [Paracoccaceae bacterium]